MDGIIDPLLDWFSYIGIPVKKRHSNGEQDYSNDGESDLYEAPARVYQINVPRAKLTVNPSYQSVTKFRPFNDNNQMELTKPVRHLNCGPEIPILLINKNNQSYIMHTQTSDIPFHLYRKISEMHLTNGMDTLNDFLTDISKIKETDPVAKSVERPKGKLVQGGIASSENVANICSRCTDDIINRPKFPILSVNDVF